VNRWQNVLKGFRQFSPSNDLWNQELIEPRKSVRRRTLLALTLPVREEISRGTACGSSIRAIAELLDRAASGSTAITIGI
jgi:hypothetical protein